MKDHEKPINHYKSANVSHSYRWIPIIESRMMLIMRWSSNRNRDLRWGSYWSIFSLLLVQKDLSRRKHEVGLLPPDICDIMQPTILECRGSLLVTRMSTVTSKPLVLIPLVLWVGFPMCCSLPRKYRKRPLFNGWGPAPLQ